MCQVPGMLPLTACNLPLSTQPTASWLPAALRGMHREGLALQGGSGPLDQYVMKGFRSAEGKGHARLGSSNGAVHEVCQCGIGTAKEERGLLGSITGQTKLWIKLSKVPRLQEPSTWASGWWGQSAEASHSGQAAGHPRTGTYSVVGSGVGGISEDGEARGECTYRCKWCSGWPWQQALSQTCSQAKHHADSAQAQPGCAQQVQQGQRRSAQAAATTDATV